MSDTRPRLALRLAGPALFLVALAVAVRSAPEWMVRETPSPAELSERFDEVAARAGYEITSAARKSDLKFGPSSSDITIRGEASDQFGRDTRDWLIERGLGLFATVEAPATHSSGMQGMLNVSTDMQGNVAAIEFTTRNMADFLKPGTIEVDAGEYRQAALLLLRPGESLGEPEEAAIGAQRFVVFPIIGSEPPESVTATEPPGIRLLNRRPGSPDDIRAYYKGVLTISNVATRGLSALIRFLIGISFGVLFIVLAVKRSIGLRTGVMFGATGFICAAVSGLDEVAPGWIFWLRMVLALLVAGWCIVVWSGAESWLRTVEPRLLQTIDTIASFRPGPKSGNAIIDGWFAGLGLAGLALLLEAVPGYFGLISSSSAVLKLSIFGVHSPLTRAIFLSGGILAAAAAAHYFTGRAERALAIALTTVMVLPVFGFAHWTITFIGAALIASALRSILLSGGAAAVLSTTLNLFAAPAAVFALRHFDWMPISAAAASVLVGAPLVFALVGLRKPPENETQQIVTPRFMRRLEEERRVRFEMGLLAEMQLKMLPDSAPAIGGWDIAAHSVLASEVGGDLYDYLEDQDGNIWIAIGDVSGHGYQCAIAQAMTKASLTSLVSASFAPSQILAKIDKVLRRGGSARTFTSLALAKLDPRTGSVIVSNAGNPYPVHVTADGRISEIEIPSLPLGMGPARTYTDVQLQIAPRDYLLFYSDGLVEVRNRNEEMLGFDKPAALVRMRRGQSAAEIVSGLEKAWSDHLGEGEIQDDTTIVVVRRE